VSTPSRTVGIIANPMSGKDVRRLAARASTTTPEIKRDQVARAVIGAVAGGATRVLLVQEPFRISAAAVENLELDASIELLDVGAELSARDTTRAAQAMREAGVEVLIALGGDGTQRAVAKAWPEVVLLPLSTGTNNVFPLSIEATAAGAAAGVVASGQLDLAELAPHAKCVRIEVEGEPPDLALIDAALVVDDALGNFMPFLPHQLRRVVLSRAEPASVGMSPIGGLLEPCTAADDFGVEVRCTAHGGSQVRDLQVPISPGLYRTVHVAEARRLALEEEISLEGPGLLAFDGDRERACSTWGAPCGARPRPVSSSVRRRCGTGWPITEAASIAAEPGRTGTRRMKPEPLRVVFVCLGNICRSPTAEGIFLHQLAQADLADRVEVDSAGTAAYHTGEPADRRSAAAARRRGVRLVSRARPFVVADFERFDWVIAMDGENHADLLALAPSSQAAARIHLLRDFDRDAPRGADVPDPYYGGEHGFDDVFELCESACRGLLAHLQEALGARGS
jgi:protein-tyrosine phosphatase